MCPLQEGQVCIHLAREANRVDGWEKFEKDMSR